MRLLAAVALAFLAGCTTLRPTPPVRPLPSDEAFAWPSVLQTFVDERGRIDFSALAANPGALEIAVAAVGARSPRDTPEEFPAREEQVAFDINAYNALATYSLVRSGLGRNGGPGRLSSLDRVDFFRLTKVVVGGQAISLQDYRDDLIRRYGDERIHFALACMAVSCPRLPRVPFTAAGLNAGLEAAARLFLSDPRNVELDPTRRIVRLSWLLDTYAADFQRRAPSLVAYVNRYRTEAIPADYRVEFIPPDWTIDAQPRP